MTASSATTQFAASVVPVRVSNGMATPATLVVRWNRSVAKAILLPTVGRANRFPYCRVVAATETQTPVNSTAALLRSRYLSA